MVVVHETSYSLGEKIAKRAKKRDECPCCDSSLAGEESKKKFQTFMAWAFRGTPVEAAQHKNYLSQAKATTKKLIAIKQSVEATAEVSVVLILVLLLLVLHFPCHRCYSSTIRLYSSPHRVRSTSLTQLLSF